MENAFKISIFSFIIAFNIIDLKAQEDVKKVSPFSFKASYIGDVVSNFSGGIKRGTTYLGLANIKSGFDTETANWWKGGTAFINLANTHGGMPSKNLVGDFQGVSNIEAGNITFLFELWYKQSVGKVDLTLGLQDLNANFAASENGALFSNSSFGIQSSIADNTLSPIFPLTALGLNVQWNISDGYLWKTAVFDGTPDDFESNPYNVEWKLSKDQGYMAVSELQVNKSLLKGKKGCYKLGAYYHQHNDTIDAEQKNSGLYFVIDQQISSKLSLFSQIGFSPKSKDSHNHYYSLGLNYKGLIDKCPEDQFGMAVAYAQIDDRTIGSETTIELTYQFELNKNIYLRPDIQYIINPAGTTHKLNNALVGFIRMGVNF
ncbi:MAG: carbohydrate porin [Paludibacter sp.]